MEILLSTVLGEAINRSLNFFFSSKCSKLQAQDVEDRLCRVLLRAQVILEEAMGRHITNQAMLQQLDMLRGAMHRGCYMLDTFRCRAHDDEEGNSTKDHVLSRSLSSSLSSKPNSLKGFCCYFNRNTQILDQLQESLDNLSSMMVDTEEMVMFLASYRRLYRQPYSMHLLLGNCMFGRQMEAQLAIKFLLHTQPQGGGPEELEVLPIVGPRRLGKSTLVAHVCMDERVCDRFSEILLLHDHDFADDELGFREGCAIMKLQDRVTNLNKGERLLIVVELIGDLNDDAWNRLCSASKRCVPRGSKIIVTSRSDKVARFGTTQVLTVKHLPQETYWYFFKTLAFGSVDPNMHPRFVQVAMEIAQKLNGYINGANVVTSFLRDNFEIHLWCKMLALLNRSIQKHLSNFGEHPLDLLNQGRPALLGRMATPSEGFLVLRQYQCSSEEEIPKIGFQDLVFGGVKPQGKFDILLWKSRIPPYYSYIYTCEIRELKTAGAKRKHSMKNGVTLG